MTNKSHLGRSGPKVRYATRADADAAIARRGLLLAYHCRTCDGFHLRTHGIARTGSQYTRLHHSRRPYELPKVEIGERAAGCLHAENVGKPAKRQQVIVRNATRALKRIAREAVA